MHILQNKHSFSPEYLIIQVESFSENGFPLYTIYHTDVHWDATKFNSKSSLLNLEEGLSLNLHCDLLEDYEIKYL